MNSTKPVVRAITEAELEAAIALDNKTTGRSRRGFYLKRFAASQQSPESFVWLASMMGDKLVGFVSAHVLDGEFGGTEPAAVIDAIGVLPEARGKGIARTLLETLEVQLKARKITNLYTEADWVEHDLVQFFAAAGFQLAPSLVLESAVTTNF